VTNLITLRRVVAAACAAAALVAGIPATSANAATAATASPGMQVGVQFHGLWSSYSDADRATVLDRLAEAGAGWVRLDISWAMLQPTSRTAWSSDGLAYVDHVIDMAAARNLKVLGTFWITPAWANGGRGDRTLPNDPADYANAARVIAARWATKVRAWEVWNEPNSSDFMTGADPAEYAALLKAAYPALHAGDPTTTVVSGGTQYADDAWVAKAYAAGMGGAFDALGVHPYPGVADEAADLPDNGTVWRPAHVAAIRSLMTANGDTSKPVWFTEVGWATNSNDGLNLSDPASNWQRGVTPAAQAAHLTKLMNWSASLSYVTGVFWYAERDRAVPAGSSVATLHNARFGMLDVSLQPKPAWAALRDWTGASAPAVTPTATPAPTVAPTVTPTVAPTTAPTAAPAVSATTAPAPVASPSPTRSTVTKTKSSCIRYRLFVMRRISVACRTGYASYSTTYRTFRR
jgi:cell division septation protein DedD